MSSSDGEYKICDNCHNQYWYYVGNNPFWSGDDKGYDNHFCSESCYNEYKEKQKRSILLDETLEEEKKRAREEREYFERLKEKDNAELASESSKQYSTRTEESLSELWSALIGGSLIYAVSPFLFDNKIIKEGIQGVGGLGVIVALIKIPFKIKSLQGYLLFF